MMPEPGKLLDSRLGYYIRPGKHSMTREDWKVFLEFAASTWASRPIRNDWRIAAMSEQQDSAPHLVWR
jgi:hypothetical protein